MARKQQSLEEIQANIKKLQEVGRARRRLSQGEPRYAQEQRANQMRSLNTQLKQAQSKRNAATSATSTYENLLASTGQLAGADDMTATSGTAQTQATTAESLLSKADATVKTDKKKIENLLKAFGMREAEVRARKAAPGFTGQRSMVG